MGTRVKRVITLKCHFLRYHVLCLHGACRLAVCNQSVGPPRDIQLLPAPCRSGGTAAHNKRHAQTSTAGLGILRGKTPVYCRERMTPWGEGEPGGGRSPSAWGEVLHRFTQAGWLCGRAESRSPAGVSAEKVRGMGGFVVRYLICISAAPLALRLSYFGPQTFIYLQCLLWPSPGA